MGAEKNVNIIGFSSKLHEKYKRFKKRNKYYHFYSLVCISIKKFSKILNFSIAIIIKFH